jgi:succinoglycan biosynthesis protein ExoM
MRRICIAVPTYRRTAYLRDLLPALARLTPVPECTVDVVIADNDPDGGARDIVTEAQAAFPFALRYELVRERGLCAVRNFVLAYARDRADAIAMLDDDELPEPQWLAELLRVAQATGADAVVGPVPAIPPPDAPRWIREARDRELPRFADGAFVSDGWCGNCLVRVPSVAAFGLSFDATLNFAGGEDQLFFRNLLAGGGTIAYAAHATAWEIFPPARRSVGFMLKRSFRRGNSLAVCELRLRSDAKMLALRALKGFAVIALGFVQMLPLAVLRGGSRGAVASASEIARGAGMLAGLAGVSYQAYRRSV